MIAVGAFIQEGHMSTDQWRHPRVRGYQRYWTWRVYTNATRLPGFALDEAAKRILDIVAATIGIILFAPTLLIIPLAIKLGLPRPGQILSETGIDQLPQLFDVLRGQMSILGQRNMPRWPSPAVRLRNNHRIGDIVLYAAMAVVSATCAVVVR